LGVLGSIEFCGFGATNSIGNFVNPSTFASTFAIHGPTAFGEPIKKREKKVNIKRVFKEEWVAQFPWAEHVVDFTSKINMVFCKIFFLVDGEDKLLNPKLDGLQMHVGKRKALILRPILLVGDYYINK
jgi:hypothetical protein